VASEVKVPNRRRCQRSNQVPLGCLVRARITRCVTVLGACTSKDRADEVLHHSAYLPSDVPTRAPLAGQQCTNGLSIVHYFHGCTVRARICYCRCPLQQLMRVGLSPCSRFRQVAPQSQHLQHDDHMPACSSSQCTSCSSPRAAAWSETARACSHFFLHPSTASHSSP
jgi:hypothetical protein